MDSVQNRPPGDQELIDTLIAISVVAKQLARKLEKQRDNKERSSERCGEAPEERRKST